MFAVFAVFAALISCLAFYVLFRKFTAMFQGFILDSSSSVRNSHISMKPLQGGAILGPRAKSILNQVCEFELD